MDPKEHTRQNLIYRDSKTIWTNEKERKWMLMSRRCSENFRRNLLDCLSSDGMGEVEIYKAVRGSPKREAQGPGAESVM